MVAVVHVPVVQGAVQGAVRVLAMAVVVEDVVEVAKELAKELLPNHSINKKRFVMKQKKTNEELQSRREFFKKAAKAALPVVGAVLLSQVSTIPALAATECSGCTGACVSTCAGACMGTCKGSCDSSCRGTCDGSCNAACGDKCKF